MDIMNDQCRSSRPIVLRSHGGSRRRCEGSLKTRPSSCSREEFTTGIYQRFAIPQPRPRQASARPRMQNALLPGAKRAVCFYLCTPQRGPYRTLQSFGSFTTVLLRILIHETPPWHVGKSCKATGAFAVSYSGERTSRLMKPDNDIASKNHRESSVGSLLLIQAVRDFLIRLNFRDFGRRLEISQSFSTE